MGIRWPRCTARSSCCTTAGFTDDETIEWLLTPEESIGLAPIEALRAGRKSEVRRVAQSLG